MGTGKSLLGIACYWVLISVEWNVRKPLETKRMFIYLDAKKIEIQINQLQVHKESSTKIIVLRTLIIFDNLRVIVKARQYGTSNIWHPDGDGIKWKYILGFF